MRRVAARAIVLGRMAAQAALLGKFIDAFLGGCERAMLVAAIIELLMDACDGAPRIRVANDYAICCGFHGDSLLHSLYAHMCTMQAIKH